MKNRVLQAGACLLLGLVFGWLLWHHAPVIEGEAIGRKYADGTVLAPRDPSAPIPADVKAAVKPTGGTLERSISVTVQPRPTVGPPPAVVSAPALPAQWPPSGDIARAAAAASTPPSCSCTPVTVDLGIVRMPDDTHRVTASSPDGDVIAALDIPAATEAVVRSTRWAVGASGQLVVPAGQDRHYGAWVERDLGPFRLGAEVQATARGKDPAAWVRAGIRFGLN